MEVMKWICLAAIWISVTGQEPDDTNPDTQNYQFRYFVQDESTGDVKSHEETKEGDTVIGHYSVGEPTGDKRVVTYTADKGGFRADVKYEDGGSPASEDKARQTSAKSGFDFHWLPPKLDYNQEGKGRSEEDGSGESSLGKNQSDVESTIDVTEATQESTSEVTTENLSSTDKNIQSFNKESSEVESATLNPTYEKTTKEENTESGFSSEVFSTENGSESQSKTTLGGLSTSSESYEESIFTSTMSTTQNLDASTEPSFENKSTSKTDAEYKATTESEQSEEVAESAPLSEEVLPPLPGQMYLPIISYQNLPFLNLPTLENPQDDSEKPQAVIYASQNFYNPWQWFGSNRRVARDIQHKHKYKTKSMDRIKYLALSRRQK